MEGRPAWVQPQLSGISYVALTSMVSELVTLFQNEQRDDEPHRPDWQSADGQTSVIKHGSSACMHSVLKQVPDAVLAEYEILYQGKPAFSWREYLWPHLCSEDTSRYHASMVYIPQRCLHELLEFHASRNSCWLRRYKARLRSDRTVKVDKIDVVVQPDLFQIL